MSTVWLLWELAPFQTFFAIIVNTTCAILIVWPMCLVFTDDFIFYPLLSTISWSTSAMMGRNLWSYGPKRIQSVLSGWKPFSKPGTAANAFNWFCWERNTFSLCKLQWLNAIVFQKYCSCIRKSWMFWCVISVVVVFLHVKMEQISSCKISRHKNWIRSFSQEKLFDPYKSLLFVFLPINSPSLIFSTVQVHSQVTHQPRMFKVYITD